MREPSIISFASIDQEYRDGGSGGRGGVKGVVRPPPKFWQTKGRSAYWFTSLQKQHCIKARVVFLNMQADFGSIEGATGQQLQAAILLAHPDF